MKYTIIAYAQVRNMIASAGYKDFPDFLKSGMDMKKETDLHLYSAPYIIGRRCYYKG